MSDESRLPPVPPEMLEWAQGFVDNVNSWMQSFQDQLEAFRMEFEASLMQVNEQFGHINSGLADLRAGFAADQREEYETNERRHKEDAAVWERIASALELLANTGEHRGP